MASTPKSSGPDESSVPDERLGQYARLEEIGRGGQSRVWLAIDEVLGRQVAIKEVLPPPADVAGGSEPRAAWARFLREARLTAKLDHPSIVPIHELARRPNGTLFCAQKLVRGRTLKARLEDCDSLDSRLALLPHLTDACQAIAYAHSRGVIHRDLKPSNIMVGAFGETVVVDWGLAKQRGETDEPLGGAPPSLPGLTVAGETIGTPSYMSPEQVRGALAEIDERSDVFSLGVVLYEVLTGRLPFEGDDAGAVMAKVAAGDFPRVRDVCPEAPAELAAVAERALGHDPAARYPGAEPLANELAAYRAGRRVAAYEYRSWELVQKFVARNRAASALGLAALLLLVGGSIAIGWQLRQARVSLAMSFLERARAAGKGSDWARAAGYYAASRVESDTLEGRWGVAMAREKMPRRVVTRSGPDGSYASVGFLADGRGVVLAFEPGQVVGRALDGGGELWRHEIPDAPVAGYGLAGNSQVFLRFRDVSRYLDGATGRLVGERDSAAAPCGDGPLPPLASLLRTPDGLADLVVPEADGGTRRLMSGVQWRYSLCVVSPDGRELALEDRDGTVHLWDLPGRNERTTRSTPDASDLLFTAQGLAVVRERSVQIVAADGADILIGTPGRHGVALYGRKVSAVSPDGNLLVLGHIEANEADVVDLRLRRVVSTVSYPPGQPRFAFTPAGDRLLAAGLAGDTTLVGWDLRQKPSPPGFPGTHRMGVVYSKDGRRFLMTSIGKEYTLTVHDSSGRLLRAFPLGEIKYGNGMISGDGNRVVAAVPEAISILDVDSGATVARIECENCLRGQLSMDGRRLFTQNGKEAVLWDVERSAALWRDARHPGALSEPATLSLDARHAAWAHAGVVYIRSAGDAFHELHVRGNVDDITFDGPGDRLAVTTTLSTVVFAVDGLRPSLQLSSPTWIRQSVDWSDDDSALLVTREHQGTTLIDSATGIPFATIDLPRSSTMEGELWASPDLRHAISTGSARWEVVTLPAPDDAPAAETLAGILRESGLEMRGVELVYAAGP